MVSAALHWDAPGQGLIKSSLKATFKHLLCLEYSTVAIQNKAIDDFLAGPEHIFSILESALPEVRALRQRYPDAVVLPGATALPAPSGAPKVHRPPVALPAIGARLARGCCTSCGRPTRHTTSARNSTSRPGTPAGSCCATSTA